MISKIRASLHCGSLFLDAQGEFLYSPSHRKQGLIKKNIFYTDPRNVLLKGACIRVLRVLSV